jgi:mono/diheme cytochrome c family protein
MPRAKNLLLFAALVSAAGLSAADSAIARGNDFDGSVAPLLARRCLACHNGAEKKGGLDLSSAKSALAGGDSGTVLVPGKPPDSLLWERVSKHEMPPKKPLSDEEQRVLERWIAAGAKWGADPIDPFRFTSENRAGYDWWSLQPVKRPSLPKGADAAGEQNPIDRFVLAGLAARGLKPAARADKRALIRRLSFDLLGLPPTPAEVDAFAADESPDAYAQVVERYLESPHYGERWGRHWLDVVRFGESQGFERDKLRPNAWPYRDWVISAFNDDLPYDEFVRLQLAGDVLRPADPRGTIATGFLVAAPWDEVGQTQQSAAMKAVVRQDEIEDLLAATGQTFLGLTVNCARCHDHKFDPITQAEYYKLAAMLAGSRHGERESLSSTAAVAPDREIVARREELAQSERQISEDIAKIDGPARERILTARAKSPAPAVEVPQPIGRWEFDGDLKDSIGGLHGTAHGSARTEGGSLLLDGKDGYVETPPLPIEMGPKTLAVWLTLASVDQRGGGAMTIQSPSGAVFDSVVFGEREAGQWMAGSNGFSRWQSFLAPVETEASRQVVNIAIVYGANRTITAYRHGRRYGASYTAPALAIFEARKAQILFGLRHSPPGGDRFLAGAIDRAALYDRALDADQVAALAGVPSDVVTEMQIIAELPRDLANRRQELQFDLSRVRMEKRLLAGGRTYAVSPAAPEVTYILARGNPGQKQEPVGPGVIQSLAGLSADLGIATDAPDAVRRQRLAEWVTDVRNPLTPRVIANRLWHYHFGVGIIDTPNDFGFNGGRPTHPELLDWLASELISPTPPPLRRGGKGAWSLKHLQRLIVTSATYQQSSAPNAEALKIDAGNRLLWRRSPQRLEAESLRDAMLVVAGEFNPQMGGPGFHDFRTFTFNSQFYEPIDPVGFEFNRRTVYRTWVRSGRNEFLDVFDCPDPSTASPKRAVTTTPLQALALFNNAFTFRMAERLAARVERETAGDLDSRIAYLYWLAYNRAPAPAELTVVKRHAGQHGLAALCRVVFNSNEFLYVD